MEYGKIIAVTGMPGLFELLSSKNDGAIVRSLEDKSTKFVSSRVHNFSHLESIEVFTVRDNVNLIEIFQAMEKESEKAPDGKNNAELKTYYQKVYPDLDFERVYSSDLKKISKWFDVLKENNIEIRLTELPEQDPEEEPAEAPDEAPAVAEEKESKPKKAAAKKKAEPREETEETGVKATGAKAAAKAPAKKAVTPPAEAPAKAAPKKK